MFVRNSSCRLGGVTGCLILLGLQLLFFPVRGLANDNRLSDSVYLLEKLVKAEAYIRTVPDDRVEFDLRVILPCLEKQFGRSLWPDAWSRDQSRLPLVYRSFWVYDKTGPFLPMLNRAQSDSLFIFLHSEYAGNKTDAFTAYACLCQETGLPYDFFTTLDQRSAWGAYELTHAALQYRNVFLGGCIPEAQYLQARSWMEGELVKILTNNNLYDDVRLEAAVMLFYLECPVVQEPWVQKRIVHMLDKQLEEGGWSRYTGDKISQHTTLLSIWLLLEIRQNLSKI